MNSGAGYCSEANMTSAYNNAFNVNMSSLPRVSYDPFAYGKCDTLSQYRFNPNPTSVPSYSSFQPPSHTGPLTSYHSHVNHSSTLSKGESISYTILHVLPDQCFQTWYFISPGLSSGFGVSLGGQGGSTSAAPADMSAANPYWPRMMH